MDLAVIGVLIGIISPLITVLGFFVSYRVTKKQLALEIEKLNRQFIAAKLEDIPYELVIFQSEMVARAEGSGLLEATKEYKQRFMKILAYGSKDAASLVNYISKKGREDTDGFEALTCYAILCAQLKYDLTGIWTRPSLWLRFTINDIDDKKNFDRLSEVSRKIVEELNLSNELL